MEQDTQRPFFPASPTKKCGSTELRGWRNGAHWRLTRWSGRRRRSRGSNKTTLRGALGDNSLWLGEQARGSLRQCRGSGICQPVIVAMAEPLLSPLITPRFCLPYLAVLPRPSPETQPFTTRQPHAATHFALGQCHYMPHER